jgi:hypothetical protein
MEQCVTAISLVCGVIASSTLVGFSAAELSTSTYLITTPWRSRKKHHGTMFA